MRSKPKLFNYRREPFDEQSPLLRSPERRTTTIEGDEVGPLSGADLNETIPWRLDDRAWVRIPASGWHTISSVGLDATMRLLRFSFGGSYFNLGSPLVPFAVLSWYLGWPPQYVFYLNLLALIPLGHLLDSLTEELVLPLSSGTTRTLVSIIAHIFPIVIGLSAITSNEIRLAQSFIIGSILSNLLVGLGGSFVAGAIRQRERSFNELPAATETTLLFIAAIPFVIHDILILAGAHNTNLEEITIIVSHSSSMILIILYFLWNYFKLYSHASFFDSDNIVRSTQSHYDARLRPILSGSLLIVVILIAFCAKYTMYTLEPVTASSNLTRRFVGFIVLPLIANIQLYLKTWAVAFSTPSAFDEEDSYQNKMDVAVGLTLASAVDFGLGDLPFLNILGWCFDVPIALDPELLDTILVETCIFVLAGLCVKGRSNFLQGVMCFGLYIIIVLTYVLSPDMRR